MLEYVHITHVVGWGDFDPNCWQFMLFFKGMGKEWSCSAPEPQTPFEWYEVVLTDEEFARFMSFATSVHTAVSNGMFKTANVVNPQTSK